ncbi:hypothetical protein CEUSTIGMA_g2021.t1 [Chlamydomonas eustigma]|uniref:Transmembrane protein n=1 Tax=Chlamydomonas eustigma TaxID=1157962 RepID=A0A250WVC5_9CHLO|nr:hypothetical protein CEUSTIGMA_g2021.t1 [Chlamydomonas eustigma]|eukprot:GAX74572.1 hypothetical protein CEUSTIGMA_g2021.t1 [Chlamydomonas eustigma]
MGLSINGAVGLDQLSTKLPGAVVQALSVNMNINFELSPSSQYRECSPAAEFEIRKIIAAAIATNLSDAATANVTTTSCTNFLPPLSSPSSRRNVLLLDSTTKTGHLDTLNPDTLNPDNLRMLLISQSSAADVCTPVASITSQVVINSPSNLDIHTIVAALFSLLSGNSPSQPNAASNLSACPVANASGAGWLNSTTDATIISTASAPFGTTDSVSGCNSSWAAAVIAATEEALPTPKVPSAHVVAVQAQCSNMSSIVAGAPLMNSSSSVFPIWAACIIAGVLGVVLCVLLAWFIVVARRRRRNKKSVSEDAIQFSKVITFPPIVGLQGAATTGSLTAAQVTGIMQTEVEDDIVTRSQDAARVQVGVSITRVVPGCRWVFPSRGWRQGAGGCFHHEGGARVQSLDGEGATRTVVASQPYGNNNRQTLSSMISISQLTLDNLGPDKSVWSDGASRQPVVETAAALQQAESFHSLLAGQGGLTGSSGAQIVSVLPPPILIPEDSDSSKHLHEGGGASMLSNMAGLNGILAAIQDEFTASGEVVSGERLGQLYEQCDEEMIEDAVVDGSYLDDQCMNEGCDNLHDVNHGPRDPCGYLCGKSLDAFPGRMPPLTMPPLTMATPGSCDTPSGSKSVPTSGRRRSFDHQAVSPSSLVSNDDTFSTEVAHIPSSTHSAVYCQEEPSQLLQLLMKKRVKFATGEMMARAFSSNGTDLVPVSHSLSASRPRMSRKQWPFLSKTMPNTGRSVSAVEPGRDACSEGGSFQEQRVEAKENDDDVSMLPGSPVAMDTLSPSSSNAAVISALPSPRSNRRQQTHSERLVGEVMRQASFRSFPVAHHVPAEISDALQSTGIPPQSPATSYHSQMIVHHVNEASDAPMMTDSSTDLHMQLKQGPSSMDEISWASPRHGNSLNLPSFHEHPATGSVHRLPSQPGVRILTSTMQSMPLLPERDVRVIHHNLNDNGNDWESNSPSYSSNTQNTGEVSRTSFVLRAEAIVKMLHGIRKMSRSGSRQKIGNVWADMRASDITATGINDAALTENK